MTARTRKLLVYSTLPLALMWAAYNYLDRAGRKAPAPAAQAASVSSVETPVGRQLPRDLDVKRAQEWGRDPFRSYLAGVTERGEDPESPAWRLSGIVFSQTSPLAFVNGRSVAVGDSIGQAVVVAIDRRTVTLEHLGRRVELQVNKG